MTTNRRSVIRPAPKQAAHSTENPRAGAGRAGGTNAGDHPSDAAEKHPLHRAQFLTTAAEWRQLPSEGAPEVAFAGRSNAGKSSAINALAQRNRLAFVSKTPGRTQHINFFRLESGGILADLPGYGYAAVPLATRRHWQAFLARYLAERVPLVGLVLLMDIRHPLGPLDRQLLEWFLPSGRAVRILLTKADKCSASERALALKRVRDTIDHSYGDRRDYLAVQLFSATRRLGVAEAGAAIAAWLAGNARVPAAEKERPRHQGE